MSADRNAQSIISCVAARKFGTRERPCVLCVFVRDAVFDPSRRALRRRLQLPLAPARAAAVRTPLITTSDSHRAAIRTPSIAMSESETSSRQGLWGGDAPECC